MRTLQLEQGSQEWHDARAGMITASRFKDVITPAKGEKSTSQKSYINELIAERLGATNEFFKSDYMDRGNDIEPVARSVFEFLHDIEVKEVGMIVSDCGNIGISPDGLIGDDTGIEIKCPKASTHIKYMRGGVLPLEYKTQVQGSLWISERKFWYFMSYHPQLEPFIIKVERDEDYIDKMYNIINEFSSNVDDEFLKVKKKYYENNKQ